MLLDYKAHALKLANSADITINGERPWDIHIENEDVYKKLVWHGTLGLGESYMDGWWNCERLDLLFERVLRSGQEAKVRINLSLAILAAGHLVTNMQTRMRSSRVSDIHYDLNNSFYEKMLDSRMIYSCGYWNGVDNLQEAQLAKLDMICQKLELTAGESLLDIGCGWGGMAKFAAENYGVHVTGITISKEQASYAKAVCEGLPVEIRLQDYRDVTGQFDKIVSIGMFEHVGTRNYRTFMKTVNDRLTDQGLFLLHTIGHRYPTISADPWVDKYIFPGGKIPYINHISSAIDGLFILEDWHNFGMDYSKTLLAWHENFVKHWPEFEDVYGEKFFRMWEYYLLSFAGAFSARHMQLWQLVLTKNSRQSMYHSVRP